MNLSNEPKILICFDLDFTLIDNKEGIINSFIHALKKYNIKEIPRNKIKKMIGLPLNQMFESISDYDSNILCIAFRDYYGKKGIYQVKLYPDIKKMLLSLKKKSIKLGIITSKKQEMAVKLLQYLELIDVFEFVMGESKTINSKTDPNIKTILINNYPQYEFIVVGDHPSDVKLSQLLGCPFIGVLTGSHSREDLEKINNNNSLILGIASDITPDIIYSFFD